MKPVSSHTQNKVQMYPTLKRTGVNVKWQITVRYLASCYGVSPKVASSPKVQAASENLRDTYIFEPFWSYLRSSASKLTPGRRYCATIAHLKESPYKEILLNAWWPRSVPCQLEAWRPIIYGHLRSRNSQGTASGSQISACPSRHWHWRYSV